MAAGALYTADTTLHITAIAIQNERLRRVTKVLLMPLLAGTFILCWFSVSTDALPWLVPLALLMGCAGDIFLLDPHHQAGFPLGLAFFAVGHVLYLIQILFVLAASAWWTAALIAILFLPVQPLSKSCCRTTKKAAARGIVYFLLLCTLSVFAALGMLTSFSAGTAMLFAGTLMFLLSIRYWSSRCSAAKLKTATSRSWFPIFWRKRFLPQDICFCWRSARHTSSESTKKAADAPHAPLFISQITLLIPPMLRPVQQAVNRTLFMACLLAAFLLVAFLFGQRDFAGLHKRTLRKRRADDGIDER